MALMECSRGWAGLSELPRHVYEDPCDLEHAKGPCPLRCFSRRTSNGRLTYLRKMGLVDSLFANHSPVLLVYPYGSITLVCNISHSHCLHWTSQTLGSVMWKLHRFINTNTFKHPFSKFRCYIGKEPFFCRFQFEAVQYYQRSGWW